MQSPARRSFVQYLFSHSFRFYRKFFTQQQLCSKNNNKEFTEKNFRKIKKKSPSMFCNLNAPRCDASSKKSELKKVFLLKKGKK